MAHGDGYLHMFYFQAFGDELGVRSSDFESVCSQGDRLLTQLSECVERETLRGQMNEVTDRLKRIQRLVAEKGHDIGERYHRMAEFEVALKDCYERIEEFKASLQDAMESTGHYNFKVRREFAQNVTTFSTFH